MDICTNCGEKINESSRFCTSCGSRVAKDNKDMSSTPKTRIEKKKYQSKNKRLMAVVGSIIGLLLVISVISILVKGFNKPKPNSTNVAVTKTIDQSKDKAVVNKSKSSNDNNSTKAKSNQSSNVSASDQILPASDKRVMSEEDIATLSKAQLRLARNEIYARHGYVFKSADLKKYFSSKSWYHPNPSFDGSLSEVEKQNVAILKAKEDSL